MGGTGDASRFRQYMDEVCGRPDELAALREIASRTRAASRQLDGEALTAEEQETIDHLRNRLGFLLAAAQRNIEELLVQSDRRLTERPVETTVLPPSSPASAAGAYLSMKAPLREEAAPAAAERGPSPWPTYGRAPRLVERRQAEIEALSARILEIQEGLNAL
jgi:hypothetical protein